MNNVRNSSAEPLKLNSTLLSPSPIDYFTSGNSCCKVHFQSEMQIPVLFRSNENFKICIMEKISVPQLAGCAGAEIATQNATVGFQLDLLDLLTYKYLWERYKSISFPKLWVK